MVSAPGRTKALFLYIKGAFIFLLFFTFFSCTTRNEAFVEVDAAVAQGRYMEAAQTMSGEDRANFYKDKDKVLYYLDLGMLYHYAGEYSQSVEHLDEAERLIEAYFSTSITQAAGSLLLNDNVMDYAGEDYEDIYLNVFKALDFLNMGDFDAGFVEVRRVNTKLNVLQDKYASLAEGYNSSDDSAVTLQAGSNKFYNSALARYVSLLLYRAEGDYDGARIDYEKFLQAYQLQPDIYNFVPPVDDSAIKPSSKGARVSVLAFSGRSPVKKAKSLTIATGNNQVSILTTDEDDSGVLVPTGYTNFFWPGIDSGYRFKFQLPYMDPQGSTANAIYLVVDGKRQGELYLMENMERIAEETFKVKYPIIFMKTVTRTIVKGIIAQKGKEHIQDQGGLAMGLLGAIVADVAIEASEQADLRVSRYFPAYAFVREFEIPPGEHTVAVEYFSNGVLIYSDSLGTRNFSAGNLNLVTSYANK